MLNSTEDRALAFFEDLVSDNEIIDVLKDAFTKVMEESTFFSSIDELGENIIYSFYFDEFNRPIYQVESFDLFLTRKLELEKKKSKNLIESQAAKILSNTGSQVTFFQYTENTLIELYKKSNNIDYLVINRAIVDIMTFYYTKFYKYHNFCKEYLDTLSIFRKATKKEKTTLSFSWRKEKKAKEIKYLYYSLIDSEPPFINTSLETFTKAFTNKKLEEDESIKWLCKNVKNKKTISQYSLVVLIMALYKKGYIVSDLNDFNKNIENIFSSPNGEKLRNIKNTKKSKSKNPSRIQEIQAILKGLYKIA